MSTKRLLNITPALALLFTVLLSASASAAYYQQHQSNPAMIETLEEAHANAPAYLANEYGRIYVPDPALDMYPRGTTYVYRSAGIFSATTGANRMSNVATESNSIQFNVEHQRAGARCVDYKTDPVACSVACDRYSVPTGSQQRA